MRYLTFVVSEDSWYYRYTIRKFLESFSLSKTLIYKYELHQALLLNQKEAKLYQLLKGGDTLEIDLTFFVSTMPVKTAKTLEVIYEDEDILLVNKPVNALVHTDGISQNTITNYVNHFASLSNHPCPILPVHRLDVDTSGILLFGKHPLAISYLSQLFEQGQITKEYLAWVQGTFKEETGRIDLPIGKDRHTNKQRVTSNGKKAVTTYKVLETKHHNSRLEIQIQGGRKHQIRVHFAHIHHPIIGDLLYGNADDRMMLHAHRLTFIHPRTRKIVSFCANAPF